MNAATTWIKSLYRRGVIDEGAAAEVSRMAVGDELSARDLRMLLLVPIPGPGTQAAKEAAYACVARQPHVAPSILSMHANGLGVPLPRLDSPQPPQGQTTGFSAQASFEAHGTVHTGQWCTARTRKEAQHLAQVSLLAALAEVSKSEAPPAEPPAGQPLKAAPCAELDANKFLAELTHTADPAQQQQLAEHAVVRARSGLMNLPLIDHLLFGTRGTLWQQAREAALAEAAALEPDRTPLKLLHRYAKDAGLRAPRGEVAPSATHPGHYEARAGVGEGEDSVFGPPCTSTGKAHALLRARMHLLAKLVGIPYTEQALNARQEPHLSVRGQRTAISALHEFQQKGGVSNVCVDIDPGQEPFTGRATCEFQGHMLQTSAWRTSKMAARQASAESMILLLNHQLLTPGSPQAAAVPGPRPESQATPKQPSTATVPPQRPADAPPTTLRPDHPQAPVVDVDAIGIRMRRRAATAPHDAALQALTAGHELAFDSAANPLDATWLLIDPPRHDDTDDGLVMRQLLLPCGEIDTVPCWRVDLLPLLPTLAATHTSDWSASVQLWASTARLALEVVAAGCVYPAFSDADSTRDRQPCWKAGPLPPTVHARLESLAKDLNHLPRTLQQDQPDGTPQPAEPLPALRAALDTLIDQFVPAPGAHLLFGPRPFVTPACYEGQAPPLVQDWCDELQHTVAPTEAPAMVLRIEAPRSQASSRLRATLRILRHPDDTASAIDARHLWNGTEAVPDADQDLPSRTARALRRAGRHFAPLRPLGMQRHPDVFLLTTTDAAALLGPAGQELARAGISVDWADHWVTELDAYAVVGIGTPAPLETGQLGIGELLDRRWQFSLDGTPLTETELETLAESALPCVRLRNKWILLDNALRTQIRTRHLPKASRQQAILDVLYGSVTIEGRTYACCPADGLALLIEELQNSAPTAPEQGNQGSLTLYPYQADAVHWLTRLTALGFGGLLADDMGTGKTITALAFHCKHTLHNPAPTLVICPQSLVEHWCREIAKHAPQTPVVRYQGPQRTLNTIRPKSIVVTTYHLLRRDHQELTGIEWGLVIADEAQALKNEQTQVARLIRSLAGVRLALTGTPIENRPDDLWAIMDWLNPELFNSRTQFNALYTRPLERPATDGETQDVIDRFQSLLKPFMRRRLKADLGLQLPKKRETKHQVCLSSEQIGLYEALSRDTLLQLSACPANARRGQLVLNLINSLKKICISPAHYLGEPVESVAADPDEAARRAPKLEQLHSLLHPIREQGEAALVFTTFVRAAQILRAYLTARGYRSLIFEGGLSPTQRTDVIDTFNSGGSDVLILTPQSGGVGLDLTRANHVIHYNRLWNPAAEDQANDRAHRINQNRDVMIHHLIAANSIEERITALLHRKRTLTRTLLPDGEFDVTQLDDTELLRLCSLRART